MFTQEQVENWEKTQKRGRFWGGIFLMVVGTLFLLRELEVPIASWVFSWKMLLIGIGLYSGLKHNFKRGGWFIMISIGTLFLLQDVIYGFTFTHLLWPILFILLGFYFILKPKSNYKHWHYKMKKFSPNADLNESYQDKYEQEGYISVNAIFAGVNKKVITKNFKGGEINSIFGGSEIDLSQSDFEGSVTLELNAIFGGMEIRVPNNWKIQPDVTAILGGISDKRSFTEYISPDENKLLIIKGAVIFGGVEIKGN